MGLYKKIFGKKQQDKQSAGTTFQGLTAYQPIWHSRMGEIYESELVRESINARATHFSKLQPVFTGSANPKLVNTLKRRPNEWQTWSQFLYRTSTILDVQNTAFIVPVFDASGIKVNGIYTVLPSRCEIVDVNGIPFVRYSFSDGSSAAIELASVGILTKFQYKDDFFGTNNSAINSTLDLIDLQQQGICEAVKNSATFRFMAKLTNFQNENDIKKERERFNKNTFGSDNEGGILLFPNTMSEIQQIKSDGYKADPQQMDLIEKNVFRYFGTNEDVLMNKAFGDSWTAFYEGAIEPLSIQMSDVITRMIFTETEQSYDASFTLTANRMQYMSTQTKLNVSTQLLDRGVFCLDDVLDIWNMPHLPDGKGQTHVIRGEYKNTDTIQNISPDDEKPDEDDTCEHEKDKEDIEDEPDEKEPVDESKGKEGKE